MSTEALKVRGVFADAAFEFFKLTNEVRIAYKIQDFYLYIIGKWQGNVNLVPCLNLIYSIHS